MPDLNIVPPSVAPGFCATLGTDWVQQLANEIVGKAVAKFEGVGTIVLDQDTTPDPTQRAYLWRKRSDGRTYRWVAGAWTTPHPYPANGVDSGAGPRLLFSGVTADLWSFDGGDGTNPSTNPPSTNSGAMWEIDLNYAGRSPMGVGDIPTANPAHTLTMGEAFGEGAHALTVVELPPHSHATPTAGDAFATLKAGTGGTGNTGLHTVNSGVVGNNGQLQSDSVTSTTGGTGTPAVVSAHNTVPPVRGCWIIRRSARINYIAT